MNESEEGLSRTAIADSPISAPACPADGCGRPAVARCAYIDHRGGRCATDWCRAHMANVGGLPYCRRHAAAARLVAFGGVLAVPPPAVGDRGLGLLLAVTADVRQPVLGLLESRYAQAGAGISADRQVRRAGRAGTQAWESGWAVVSRDQMLARVLLRVPAESAPRVRVVVDGGVRFDAVPDWLARRDADSHRRFGARVVEAVRVALDDVRTVPWIS